MAETVAARYWCHLCSQTVNPITEIEIQCPNCNSGFIEQLVESPSNASNDLNPNQDLNLWAPILLGMLNNGIRRRRSINREELVSEQDNDLISLFRRRQRASAILEVLNDIQDRMRSDSNNSNSLSIVERPRNREPHMILINNPFNSNALSIGDDFFMSSGLEQLIQQLGENENNRHGTPPADKKAVEAMPKVKIECENINCSICLDEFGVGEEGREMPCKHKFHDGCILPWLEMHSSCPVCRFQMPVEEREGVKEGMNEGGSTGNGDDNGGGNGDNGRRFWMPVPWPFNGLFSVSSSSSSSGSGGVEGSENVNGGENGNGDSSNSHSDVN